jgi:hypothetical protein
MQKPQFKKNSSKSQNRYLLIGILALAAIGIIVFLLRNFSGPQANAMRSGGTGTAAAEATCLSNFRSIALGMLMFSDDNNGRMPRADRWVEDLTPRYVRSAETFKCPDDKSGARSSYAMNSAFSGMTSSGIGNPASIVLIFETETPGADPSGGPESVIKNPHHPGGAIYGFADGQAVASKAIPSFGSFKSNKSNNRYLLIGILALAVIGIIIFLLLRKSPGS